MNKKALIAMSGGVDSSVCAYLAIKAGYECVGATMRLCDKDFSSTDADDAAKVCAKLGIEHHVFDFSKEFKENVMDRFASDYEKGLTPNPCIECNKYLKFGLLFDKARAMGCDTIVTGHYARTEDTPEGYILRKAKDVSKDQSYVLYSLKREMLPHVFFPLGDYTKAEARAIAEEQGFVTARKSDSQDICFVPDGDYPQVISSITGRTYPEGSFVDEDGSVLGTHKGIIRYTVGQRKGLGLALKEPMYVKEKRIDTNEVVLCTNEALFSNELTAVNCNWLSELGDIVRAKAKIRYNQTEQDATVYLKESTTARIVFDNPQRAIAKGQAVVVYDKDRVLGGGTIV